MGSLLLFLVSFGFYLQGASVSLDGGDSGEFIASSFSLGIPHAPGYPLFQLLGKFIQGLFPFSTPSYQCHILTCLMMSGLLLLFFHFLVALLDLPKGDGASQLPSVAATLFLATRPLVIEQARVVEVFGLNALFAVGILWALIHGQWLLGSFLFGLGMGNHHTLVLIFPVVVLFFMKRRKGVDIGKMFLFFGLGFSIHLYLPIRAWANPPVNFGDPETWNRFLAVLTRREFGSTSLHPSALPFREFSLYLQQTKVFGERMFHQAGTGGLVLTLMGLLVGVFHASKRIIVLSAFVMWIIFGAGFEMYSNLSPYSDIGQWRLERFYLLPLLASVVLLAVALEGVRAHRFLFVGALLILIEPFTVLAHSPSFRHNTVIRDVGQAIFRSAPENTRVIIDRVLFDEPTSSLLVGHVSEGRRPDLKFFYRPGTLFEPVYGSDLLDLSWTQRLERQKFIEGHLLQRKDVPLRVLAFDKNNTPFEVPALEGLLYGPGQPRDLSAFHLVRLTGVRSDYPTRLVAVHLPYFYGKAALEKGDVVSAQKWFLLALDWGQGMAWLSSNIGGLLAQKDLLAEAEIVFDRAVREDPYFFEAQYGRGFVALRKGLLDSAIEAYENATRLASSRAEAWYMLGVAQRQAGRIEASATSWRRYLELEPRGKMAAIIKNEMGDQSWK